MSKTPKNNKSDSSQDAHSSPGTTDNRPRFRTEGILGGFSRSPGAKFIIIGIITILLLIPAMLVWGLVEDRSRRADTVANSIAQGWGNAQTLNGPYLVIPYSKEEVVEGEGRVKLARTSTHHAIYSAASAQLKADVQVEERKKSIYSVPLYHLKSGVVGKFEAPDLSLIEEQGGTPQIDKAFLAMGISDPAGFRSEVMLKVDNAPADSFQPGLSVLTSPVLRATKTRRVPSLINNHGGIHLRLSPERAKGGFEYEIEMALNGSKRLAIVPSARTTAVNIESNWPHPGFDGRFLPETRQIGEDGFTANWTVPNLARGIGEVAFAANLPNSGSVIQINFVKPLKFYQIVSRTLKYAIAFFALNFLAVFILEMTGKRAIHWVQYTLVGLAMVVFYILLLAFAEHVGFTIAYGVSALATTLLISWYVGSSLGQKNSGLIMAGVMGLIYAIVFLVLREQEYALLAGSIIAFIAIAATMVLTRNIDWSKRLEPNA